MVLETKTNFFRCMRRAFPERETCDFQEAIDKTARINTKYVDFLLAFSRKNDLQYTQKMIHSNQIH